MLSLSFQASPDAKVHLLELLAAILEIVPIMPGPSYITDIMSGIIPAPLKK